MSVFCIPEKNGKDVKLDRGERARNKVWHRGNRNISYIKTLVCSSRTKFHPDLFFFFPNLERSFPVNSCTIENRRRRRSRRRRTRLSTFADTILTTSRTFIEEEDDFLSFAKPTFLDRSRARGRTNPLRFRHCRQWWKRFTRDQTRTFEWRERKFSRISIELVKRRRRSHVKLEQDSKFDVKISSPQSVFVHHHGRCSIAKDKNRRKQIREESFRQIKPRPDQSNETGENRQFGNERRRIGLLTHWSKAND